ncbi:hypothetical protein [Sulfurovum sp.]|uniref:hypothetical protein n=1 Tax=Sulfurovum sp. TaxID=1969726 RepID=UPI0025DAEEDC|nr:hypothetical protein [Sulfurovum sp.]
MSRILVLFSLIFTSLFSQEVEEFPFLGVTVSTQTVDLADSKNETTLGIRYGKQTVDWRTMFTYCGNSSYKSFAMEIDKILMDEMFGTPKVRPYLGFSLGTIKYKDDNLADTSGYFYGGNLGLIIYASDNIDADLGYHYYKVEEFEDLDNIQGGTLALHYFY